MSSQPKWNKYEVALLIEAYVKIAGKTGSRNEILQKLSNALRLMATNNGIEIDDTYRNLNGMQWQSGFIEKAFQKTGYGSHMPPVLFRQMTDLYTNDRNQFEQILSDAKRMIAPKGNNQSADEFKGASESMEAQELAFATWLDEQSNLKIPAKVIISVQQECDKYAVAHHISLKSFWDIRNAKEYSFVAEKLRTTYLFRVLHKKAALTFDKTRNYYADYLLATQKSEATVPAKTLSLADSDQIDTASDDESPLESFSTWLLNEKKLAEKTCVSYVSSLRSLLSYCISNGVCEVDFLKASKEDLSSAASCIFADSRFQKFNAEQHNRFSAALKKYLEYRLGSEALTSSIQQRQRNNNAISSVSDGRVDFSAGTSYTGTKPYRASICGYELEDIKTWADVYVGMTTYLCAECSEVFADISNDFSNGRSAAIVTEVANAKAFVRPTRINDTYVLETNRSTNNIIRNIAFLLGRCHVAFADVEIDCAFRQGNQPSSPKANRLAENSNRHEFKDAVTTILQRHYAFGYRLESSIELSRFCKFAAADEIELPDSDEQIKAEILYVGFLVDGKVYVLDEQVLSALFEEVMRLSADGATTLYYESIMELCGSFMEDSHIASVEMLKEMLTRCNDMFTAKNLNIYLAKNFISLQGKCTEKEAVTRELSRIWGAAPVRTVDDLDSELPCIPVDYIKRCISGNRNFAWVSEGAYLLLDRFIISPEEESDIMDFVGEKCDTAGFASISDVPLGNIEEENYELSTYAIYTAIYNKVLWDAFHLNGKILTKESSNLDVVALVEQYLADKNDCTFKESNDRVTELSGGSYRYMAYEALYNSMVRVDKERYVANRHVRFDVDAIDEVLSHIITDRFIAIKEVTTFALFPLCGQPWNHYLLESFCYRYSKKYQLRLLGFNDKNAGIIAERDVTEDYGDLLAIAAARAPIELTPTAIGKFFFDVGYMAKSKFAWLDTITEKAKTSREET